jgi:hypothetical protein
MREEKRAKEREAEIESDLMPLEFMLRRMRDPGMNEADRFAAARSSAPYCHAQLQAIAHKHMDAAGNPIAPVITVTVAKAVPAAPRLTHTPPPSDETKQ